MLLSIYDDAIAHILANKPDSCSLLSTPSVILTWQNPISLRNSSFINSCASADFVTLKSVVMMSVAL